MEIAPLIHSRTFYCDFNQNLAVRPKDLNVQLATNKILPAMRDVDILNGVRRVVATDSNICIAGVACNFRYFVENYLSAEEQKEAANYLYDERGREVKIFLGYAFKGNGVPDVPDSMLWQMFKSTLAPKWNNQTVETVIAPYENCGVKNVGKKTFDKNFYPPSESKDLELFEQCLAQRKDFCSNVDSVKIFEDGKYEIITAPQSVINRLEAQKKTPTTTRKEQSNQPTRQPFQANRQSQRISASTEKKGSSTPIIIGVIVLAILAAIAFFVMSPQSEEKEEKEERHSQTLMDYEPTLNKITDIQKSATVTTASIAWYQSAKERRNLLSNV